MALKFFCHHRKEGTLTSVECATERLAMNVGRALKITVNGRIVLAPYVIELRRDRESEYQGFGVYEPYEFVQPDATAFEK